MVQLRLLEATVVTMAVKTALPTMDHHGILIMAIKVSLAHVSPVDLAETLPLLRAASVLHLPTLHSTRGRGKVR